MWTVNTRGKGRPAQTNQTGQQAEPITGHHDRGVQTRRGYLFSRPPSTSLALSATLSTLSLAEPAARSAFPSFFRLSSPVRLPAASLTRPLPLVNVLVSHAGTPFAAHRGTFPGIRFEESKAGRPRTTHGPAYAVSLWSAPSAPDGPSLRASLGPVRGANVFGDADSRLRMVSQRWAPTRVAHVRQPLP